MNMNKNKYKLILFVFFFFVFSIDVFADDDSSSIPTQNVTFSFGILGQMLEGCQLESTDNKLDMYNECGDSIATSSTFFIDPDITNVIKIDLFAEGISNVWMKCWKDAKPPSYLDKDDAFSHETAKGQFGGYTFHGELMTDKDSFESNITSSESEGTTFKLGDGKITWDQKILGILPQTNDDVDIFSECTVNEIATAKRKNEDTSLDVINDCGLSVFPFHAMVKYTVPTSEILTPINQSWLLDKYENPWTEDWKKAPLWEAHFREVGDLYSPSELDGNDYGISFVNPYISEPLSKGIDFLGADLNDLLDDKLYVQLSDLEGKLKKYNGFYVTKDEYGKFYLVNLKYFPVWRLTTGQTITNLRNLFGQIGNDIPDTGPTYDKWRKKRCEGDVVDCYSLHAFTQYTTVLPVLPWDIDYSVMDKTQEEILEPYINLNVYEERTCNVDTSSDIDYLSKKWEIKPGTFEEGIYECVPYANLILPAEKRKSTGCDCAESVVTGTFYIQAKKGYKKVCDLETNPCVEITTEEECDIQRHCYWDHSDNKCKDAYVAANPCNDVRIRKVLKIIGFILFIAKIAVPIIIIGFGTFDLAKAVIGNDDKDLSKQVKRLVMRVVAGIIIFFIPTIVNALFKLSDKFNIINDDKYETCRNCLLDPTDDTKCDTSSD